jgi:hypothetical protein
MADKSYGSFDSIAVNLKAGISGAKLNAVLKRRGGGRMDFGNTNLIEE